MHGAIASQRRAWPSRLPGLAMWQDGSDLASITDAGGGAVSEWRDISGNGRHLTQATPTARPATNQRTVNGRNVINFWGTTQFMDTASFTIAQPITTFTVVVADVAAGKMSILSRVNDAGDWWRVQKNADGKWELWAGVALIGPSADTSLHRFTTVANGASSLLRIDGSQTSGNAGTYGISDGVRFCRGPAAQTDYLNGAICENIICSGVISSENITLTETYLQEKWGS